SGTAWGNAFVVKISPTGSVLWARQYGNANETGGLAVAVDAASNAYVTGFFFGSVNFGGISRGSAGNADIFVLKLDANGNTVWADRFGGTGYDIGVSIAATAGGTVVVGGAFANTVNFGSTSLSSAGDDDAVILKLGSGGSVLWAQSMGAGS